MNLYRVTIKLVKPKEPTQFYSKWLEAVSTKSVRKQVTKKLKKSNWELVGIYFERPATIIRKRRYYYEPRN